jgi:Asp-tRNA(Asn)/Glu-tRNA(Gln) amidotransferase A subunit family amidase
VQDAERLTASDASALIAAGRLKPSALTEACLARVAARDDTVRAWTHVDPSLVRSEAAARDREPARSPLHGIPVGIKDVFLTQDMPTSYNSAHFEGFFPRIDAAAVSVLRQAGAIIFGKNDTVEFAVNGRRARTTNPHDPARTPGGSSSGSAAAVADFQVPLSIGTQTGGSVIRPASYCGVWGMKPTWNAVPHEGFKVCSASIDTVGWYGRSAADLAMLSDVFALVDDDMALPVDLSGLRIACCRSPAWDHALQETRWAFDVAVQLLRDRGADVEELVLDGPFLGLTAAHKIVMQGEMRSAFLPEKSRFGDALYPELQGILSNAGGQTRADLVGALDLAAECRRRFDALAGEFSAVLTPSTPGVAPLGPHDTGAATFNRIWTLLHTPCVNVPGFSGPDGLPLGLTVTGPRFRDRRVLAIAGLLGNLIDQARVDLRSLDGAGR